MEFTGDYGRRFSYYLDDPLQLEKWLNRVDL